jgi:hypothetical protein
VPQRHITPVPRPPFILSRQTECAAIDRAVREPTKRQLLYEMVDAVLRVRESGLVSPRDLAPIISGFEATDVAVWSRAAGWLAKLCAFSPSLAATLDELARHRSAVVRFNLCASLDRFGPDVAVPHLRRFLTDRSARVRDMALNVAVKAGYSDLVADFEALLAQERDPERQKDIQQAIALLRGETFSRDGWLIRKLADGNIEYV